MKKNNEVDCNDSEVWQTCNSILDNNHLQNYKIHTTKHPIAPGNKTKTFFLVENSLSNPCKKEVTFRNLTGLDSLELSSFIVGLDGDSFVKSTIFSLVCDVLLSFLEEDGDGLGSLKDVKIAWGESFEDPGGPF